MAFVEPFFVVHAGRAHAGRSFLAATALVDTILVVATAPNDGGVQWGARYLLFGCIPLSVLAADGLAWMWRQRALMARLDAAGIPDRHLTTIRLQRSCPPAP